MMYSTLTTSSAVQLTRRVSLHQVISGGRISVTIESTDDTSTIEAMLNSQFKPVEGKIVYKKSEEDAKDEGEFLSRMLTSFNYKETLRTLNNEAPIDYRYDFLC